MAVRDPTLKDSKANRVGERIKVVPGVDVGHNDRIPINLTSEEERAFVTVVIKLAAEDGERVSVWAAR